MVITNVKITSVNSPSFLSCLLNLEHATKTKLTVSNHNNTKSRQLLEIIMQFLH